MLCSPKLLISIFIISAIPLGFIILLERSKYSTNVYEYHSNGWMRECGKWDDVNHRFIVSYMEGGVGQIVVPQSHIPGTILEENTVFVDSDLAGNGSLGLVIDRPRNRLLLVSADIKGGLYGALSAYDLSNWNRLFLTLLSVPGDGQTLADDVAVDDKGNAYVTDAKSHKIWKVGVNGELLSIIKSPLFIHDEWYKNLVTLNGIVYHPNGFLLVIHTVSGKLYKIDTEKDDVKLVKVQGGSLALADGIELLSPNKIVVAGIPSGRVVESLDDWETATVVAKYSGPMHQWASAVTVKDEKVYLNYLFGLGLPKRKHVFVEAVFTPIKQ
ncbi:hypothetical protein IFM89_008015 [Coptis chinensis]|uniref:Uncharacterized protein n=1 Tax=Coptis chinensis TaxID=261450 RepID=A0A835LYY3_9MAGN|nr:hypothetical protein IFM89_008015 [Coptis chinensis]